METALKARSERGSDKGGSFRLFVPARKNSAHAAAKTAKMRSPVTPLRLIELRPFPETLYH
jgi:hypothetical protein